MSNFLGSLQRQLRPLTLFSLFLEEVRFPLLAFGIGESNEMMSDMGIAMMGGMIVSTLVTLVFTPVFYSVIDDIPKFFRRLFGRKKTAET